MPKYYVESSTEKMVIARPTAEGAAKAALERWTAGNNADMFVASFGTYVTVNERILWVASRLL